MEVDSDSNSISEAGKSFSVSVFSMIVSTNELYEDDGKPECPFPSFFIQLTTDLKLKILDSVSGVDIAKVSCVCSELRYLASSDDLWKQKYVAQFGNCNGAGSERSFKERFVKAWEGRKSGSEGSCLNTMRRHCFNPIGCDLSGVDEEWLNIVCLCVPVVGVPQLRNEMADVKL